MNQTINTISSLRTTHGDFSEKEISTADLETILQASIRAANASNRQSYSIIVLDDPQTIEDICGYRAGRALLYCVDYNRLIDLAHHLGHTFCPDSPVDFVTGSVDTILAAQTAAVAARSLGIDSLFTNGIHRKDLRVLRKTLSLPVEHCFPLILLVLGYAQKEPDFQKGRASQGIIHYHQYHHLSPDELDQSVADYDDIQNHLGLNENWNAQGFVHYFDWFFKVWSGGNEALEKQFEDCLNQTGFFDARPPKN